MLLLWTLPLLLLTGCLEDECRDRITYQVYETVTITEADWRGETFTYEAPTDVCEPSGFYVYGDYLFVIDRNEGLHIFDNEDNDNPRALGFIGIPGGQGIAVRNGILYISQYLDLVTFDLSNPEEPTFLKRAENVFEVHSVFANQIAATGEYVVQYIPTDETVEVDCNSNRVGDAYFVDNYYFAANTDLSTLEMGMPAGAETVGQGGSLARFTITNSTLYAVDDSKLRTFSLATPAQPELIGTVDLGWGIETIFPYGDQLYIGSTTGMHIYDASDPLAPEHLSTFRHVQSCDPVVVQDDIAYVTMWGGSSCGSIDDRLIVIDVSDPRDPRELQSTIMSQSHGLGVSGDRLYLCSGTEGLKVFELSDKGLLGKQIGHDEGFNARDVIVRGDRQELIVFGWERAGIRQYDFNEAGGLTPVSALDICH